MVEEEAALDAAQETWLRYRTHALREEPDWSRTRASAWVHRVATHQAISWRRKQAFRLV